MRKVLLLHGWNYRNYTNLTSEKDAWHNRADFVRELSKSYDIYKLNFPGFCGEKEPNNKAWSLNDFARYVKDFLDTNNLKVDFILGYSFGGAVAIMYNRIYDNNQKLILISPAITRNFVNSKNYIKTPKFFKPFRVWLRDLYLIYIVKNNYMVYGTKFLRNTYQSIVRVELLEELTKINPDDMLIIYGGKDNMVKPYQVIEKVPNKYKKRIFVIENGEHNIGQTNSLEVIKIINENIK